MANQSLLRRLMLPLVLAAAAVPALAVEGSSDPASAPTLPSDVPADYVLYKTNVPGFTIRGPVGYQSQPQTDAKMRLMLWHEDGGTGISVRDNGDLDTTAEQVFNDAKDDASRGLKLVKKEYVKVGPVLAVREDFEVTKDGYHMRLVQTVILRDHHSYILAALSGTLDFDELTKMNEGIIASAQFPKEPPAGPAIARSSRPLTHRRVTPSENAPTGGEPLNIPDRLAAPTPEQSQQDWKAIDTAWHFAGDKAVELLPTMKSTGGTANGVTVLSSQRRIETSEHFKPPVTFQITALTNVNDLRIAYPADQVIFNWEMRPTELRIDGGPASGKYLPGAGRLPANTWVGIEMAVTDKDLTLYVNGTKVYNVAADFSTIDAPLKITSHTGTTSVKSVRVIQNPSAVATTPHNASLAPQTGSKINPPMVRPRPSAGRDGLPEGMEKSKLIGGSGGIPFLKTDPAGRPLVGLQLKLGHWDNHDMIGSVEPLYEKPARPTPNGATVLLARDGYVVAGAWMNGTTQANAIRLIFAKKTDKGVDLKTAYVGPWCGQLVGTDRTRLGCTGKFVTGVFGRQGLNTDALGLVLLSTEATTAPAEAAKPVDPTDDPNFKGIGAN